MSSPSAPAASARTLSPLWTLPPLLAVLAALVLAGVSAPDTQPVLGGARDVAVDARVVTCFALPAGSAARSVAAGVVAVPGLPAGAGPTRLRSPRLGLPADPIGGWGTASLPGGDHAAVEVSAEGAAAGGLAAVSTVVADDAEGGGLAVQQCAEPAREWWFLGAGSTPARSGAVVLHAADDADAVVDVVLHGPAGVLDTVGSQDVLVEAGSTVTLPLADVVAGTEDVAVQVRTSQGRVVASVADTWGEGLEPAGTEWLPPAAPPARTVLVPGVGAAGDTARPPVLVVANAQPRSVVARVALSTGSGRSTPPDAESVRVPAGGVATLDLPDESAAGASVEVRAQSPVTASVRLDVGADVAHPTGAPWLTGPAVVPVDLGRRGVDVSLCLAALLADPESQKVRTRSVGLRGVDGAGARIGQGSTELVAGSSRAIDLAGVLGLTRAELATLAYVVVTPEPQQASAAPVVAAVTARTADGVSVLPLRSLETTVRVPGMQREVVPPTLTAGADPVRPDRVRAGPRLPPPAGPAPVM